MGNVANELRSDGKNMLRSRWNSSCGNLMLHSFSRSLTAHKQESRQRWRLHFLPPRHTQIYFQTNRLTMGHHLINIAITEIYLKRNVLDWWLNISSILPLNHIYPPSLCPWRSLCAARFVLKVVKFHIALLHLYLLALSIIVHRMYMSISYGQTLH